MSALAESASQIDDTRARRNAVVLAVAQAFGGAQATIVVAAGSLAGYYLLGADKSLATLPPTSFLIGTACGTVPAALLMRRVGRRAGLMAGMSIGVAAGLISMQGIILGLFWMLCAGSLLGGFAAAFAQQFRFAAADTASEEFRPKAIAWVMAGGVAAGVIGPQTVIHFKDIFDPIPFAGAFLGQAAVMAAAFLVLIFLRIPRLPVAPRHMRGRPILEIMRTPRFIVSVLCAVTAYAIMSFVMTAAPLAMVACGFDTVDAAFGIQWHVIAMFAPSFFTGSLINRFGKETIVATGLLLLLGCALVALSGIDLANFYIALILLGIGWNFGFIGATAMVTETYRPEERAKVQGANDFIVFGIVAFASLMSGQVLAAAGWAAINVIVLPFLVLCFAMLTWLAIDRRRRSRA
ncbi:MAG: MFS transporter [Proteobacteria bacterium]|nr:MFS transporter [Pseudomonadota bacterium]